MPGDLECAYQLFTYADLMCNVRHIAADAKADENPRLLDIVEGFVFEATEALERASMCFPSALQARSVSLKQESDKLVEMIVEDKPLDDRLHQIRLMVQAHNSLSISLARNRQFA